MIGINVPTANDHTDWGHVIDALAGPDDCPDAADIAHRTGYCAGIKAALDVIQAWEPSSDIERGLWLGSDGTYSCAVNSEHDLYIARVADVAIATVEAFAAKDRRIAELEAAIRDHQHQKMNPEYLGQIGTRDIELWKVLGL